MKNGQIRYWMPEANSDAIEIIMQNLAAKGIDKESCNFFKAYDVKENLADCSPDLSAPYIIAADKGTDIVIGGVLENGRSGWFDPSPTA